MIIVGTNCTSISLELVWHLIQYSGHVMCLDRWCDCGSFRRAWGTLGKTSREQNNRKTFSWGQTYLILSVTQLWRVTFDHSFIWNCELRMSSVLNLHLSVAQRHCVRRGNNRSLLNSALLQAQTYMNCSNTLNDITQGIFSTGGLVQVPAVGGIHERKNRRHNIW